MVSRLIETYIELMKSEPFMWSVSFFSLLVFFCAGIALSKRSFGDALKLFILGAAVLPLAAFLCTSENIENIYIQGAYIFAVIAAVPVILMTMAFTVVTVSPLTLIAGALIGCLTLGIIMWIWPLVVIGVPYGLWTERDKVKAWCLQKYRKFRGDI